MTNKPNLVQLHGISKKSDELRRIHLLKTTGLTDVISNPLPTHVQRKPSVNLSREARQSMGKYVERKKLPGEAKAAELSVWDRTTYRTGDGDHTAQVPRAGSLRAFSLPSKGNRT